MLKVRVTTYTSRLPKVVAEGVESTKEIDWQNTSDRIWLANHTTWAMHNGCAILLNPSK